MACQDGLTCIRVEIKGLNIEIPFRTIFLASGSKKALEDGSIVVSVNLENSNHRFLTFCELKPSDQPSTKINWSLSDQKQPVRESFFEKLNFGLALKHSNCLRLIKTEILRQDFVQGTVPNFIKGQAYQLLFDLLLVSYWNNVKILNAISQKNHGLSGRLPVSCNTKLKNISPKHSAGNRMSHDISKKNPVKQLANKLTQPMTNSDSDSDTVSYGFYLILSHKVFY